MDCFEIGRSVKALMLVLQKLRLKCWSVDLSVVLRCYAAIGSMSAEIVIHRANSKKELAIRTPGTPTVVVEARVNLTAETKLRSCNEYRKLGVGPVLAMQDFNMV